MADHLVDVQSSDQHTVKPGSSAGSIRTAGRRLGGGWLSARRPSARLSGPPARRRARLPPNQHTINLFVASDRAVRDRPIEARSIRGFHLRQRTRRGMTFWAVSDLNDAEVSEFVRAMQAQ
jgi:hypothetical protein